MNSKKFKKRKRPKGRFLVSVVLPEGVFISSGFSYIPPWKCSEEERLPSL